MVDIFDEVNEDLRAERAQRLLRQYGYLLVIAAVAVVAAVGGYKFWQHRQSQARDAVAASYMEAAQAADARGGTGRADATQLFASMAANGPAGYRTLARLREAALKADAGDLPAALALWDKVSADDGADPDLRHAADLMWVQHQLQTGEPAVVAGRLAPLLANDSPWRPLALESEALLKLRTGDAAAAIAAFRQVLALPSSPAGVRGRAEAMLGQLGAAPVAGPAG